MTTETIGVSPPPTSQALTFGTATYFSRMTGVDLETSAYWVSTVDRPAHRMGHPRLNVEGCPGCVFERAVA